MGQEQSVFFARLNDGNAINPPWRGLRADLSERFNEMRRSRNANQAPRPGSSTEGVNGSATSRQDTQAAPDNSPPRTQHGETSDTPLRQDGGEAPQQEPRRRKRDLLKRLLRRK